MDKIYKLLRNNRQTGPHTLDELVQMGLKPYDLIWADGKTAGWMYPSEIDVFKPYLTEEKSEPVKTETPTSSSQTPPLPIEPVAAPTAEAARVMTVPSSAKHIFISLPAGATRVQAAPVQNNPVQEPVAEEETPEQKLERKAVELRQRVQAAAEAKKAEEAKMAEPEEPTLDTKYARSLEDIKEEYAHWMHEQRDKGIKKRISIKAFKGQGTRVALVLVIAGAGYGVFQWLSAPAAPDSTLSISQPVTTAPVSTAATKEEEPGQSVINTDYSERNTDLLTDLEKANRQIEADLERIRSKEKPVAQTRKAGPPVEYDMTDTYDAYEEEPAVSYERKTTQPAPPSHTPVRTASVRTEKKAVPLSQQIEVQAKYLWTGRSKGLSGLDLSLRNNSPQVLKTVAIDVFYYKDDRLLDKKTVYFNDVQPGESLRLTAPGNRRASSATYQLGLISSEGGLYVAKGS